MKRNKAKPFRALFSSQQRMMNRHHIGWLYIPLALVGSLILRILITGKIWFDIAALFVCALSVEMSIFAAGSTIREKENGLLPAFYISGIKPVQYLFSRILPAMFSAVVSACILAWFSDPEVLDTKFGEILWYTILNGNLTILGLYALTAFFLSIMSVCFSMIPARFSSTMDGYSLSGAGLSLLLMVPPVWDVFSPLPDFFTWHPVVAAARLIKDPALLEPGLMTMDASVLPHMLIVCGSWTLLSLILGLLSVRGMLRLKGGRSE